MSAANRQAWRVALAGQSLIRHDPLPGAGPETLALVDLLRGCDAAFTNFEGSYEEFQATMAANAK